MPSLVPSRHRRRRSATTRATRLLPLRGQDDHGAGANLGSHWYGLRSATTTIRPVSLPCRPVSLEAGDEGPGLLGEEPFAELPGFRLKLAAAHTDQPEKGGAVGRATRPRVGGHEALELCQVMIVTEPVGQHVQLVSHGLHHRRP